MNRIQFKWSDFEATYQIEVDCQ